MTEPRTSVPWLALSLVAVLVNTPLVHGTLTGADPGPVVVLVTLIADAALVAVVLLARHASGPED